MSVLSERGGIRLCVDRGCVFKQLADLTDGAAERLRAEAELLAAAQGPGVIALRGTTDDPPGVVLEYAAGGSLADRLHAHTLAQAAHMVATLAEVLARLHARGIVHRDVKPSNVLFTARGELRLADFGVAARTGGRTLGDDWEELRVGTPPYAAPEQPAAAAHPSADVYALGVILYELLAGRLPWEPRVGEDDEAFAVRIRTEPPAFPADLPRAFQALVLESLARRAEDRPSAAEFARRARRAARWMVLRRGAAAAVVCAVLVLLLTRIVALPA